MTIHLDIKDNDGRTAVDAARVKGYNNIVKLITNYKVQPRGQFSIIIMSWEGIKWSGLKFFEIT